MWSHSASPPSLWQVAPPHTHTPTSRQTRHFIGVRYATALLLLAALLYLFLNMQPHRFFLPFLFYLPHFHNHMVQLHNICTSALFRWCFLMNLQGSVRGRVQKRRRSLLVKMAGKAHKTVHLYIICDALIMHRCIDELTALHLIKSFDYTLPSQFWQIKGAANIKHPYSSLYFCNTVVFMRFFHHF